MSAQTLLNHTLVRPAHSPIILYLHGFLGCLEDWDEVVAILGDRFGRLPVNLPGHLMSPADIPAHAYSMPGCAELLIRLLDQLEIESCFIAGYSMGGRLGLYLLTHYPQRFDAAVIESASPGLKSENERTARRLQDQQLIEQLRNQPLEEFLGNWYAQPLFGTVNRASPRFITMLQRRRTHDPDALALSLEHMGAGAMPSLWDRLPAIASPVLFVAGEKDVKYRALTHEMADLCPRGQVAIISNAGHNAHFERPDEYCHMLTQFLSGNY